jgi:3-oxoacyl-[acyl-carrier-protein] synthase II
MSLALQNSNLTTDSINYINAHSTSTPAGDLAEIVAIKRLFKNASNRDVYISSLKGSLGKNINWQTLRI